MTGTAALTVVGQEAASAGSTALSSLSAPPESAERAAGRIGPRDTCGAGTRVDSGRGAANELVSDAVLTANSGA